MRRLAAKAISALPDLLGRGDNRRWRFAVFASVGAVLALGGGAVLAPREGAKPQHISKMELGAEKLGAEKLGTELGGEELGGETVIVEFAEARTEGGLAEPTPLHRLLSMALAPVPNIAPPPGSEPNLAGLSEIPPELIWNRPESEEEEDGPRASFAAFSEAQEQLPWDAVEPVPFAALAPAKTGVQPDAGATPSASESALPATSVSGEIDAWLKTKVTEIKGADRSRPLYHFELWLEPPAALKRQLLGVSYEFSTPAIRPQSQASSDSGSGFRISAGGLACADEIIVTLRFADGRVEAASVDGCKLLS